MFRSVVCEYSNCAFSLIKESSLIKITGIVHFDYLNIFEVVTFESVNILMS